MTYMVPITPPHQTSGYTTHGAVDLATGHEWTVYLNPHHVDFRPLHGSVDEHEQRAADLARAMSSRNARVYTKTHGGASLEYGVRVRYDGAVPAFKSDESAARA